MAEPKRLDFVAGLAALMVKHGLTSASVDGVSLVRPLLAPPSEPKPKDEDDEEETDEQRIARMSPDQIDAAFHAAKLQGMK